MGAANDFYHTRDSAGGGAGHGTADDRYHPYCNCQVCIVFDKKGKLVARDPDTGEAVPYDAADMMRRYDEAGHPTFAKSGLRSSSRSNRSGKPAVLSEEEFDAAIHRLSEASTVEELHAAGERVVAMWKAGKAGRDEAQWRRMSKFAKEREKVLASGGDGKIPPKPPAKKTGGSKEPPGRGGNRGSNDPLPQINSKQFGRKMGEHARDFGYKPSDLQKVDVREKLTDRFNDIIRTRDERLVTPWPGQDGLCVAYVKDGQVVLLDREGKFVTAFKEYEGGNPRLNKARNALPGS